MMQQIINKWRAILPHGFLEQTGVVLWVISVLVIGLRIALRVPDQFVFLRALQLSSTVLSSLGLAAVALAGLIALIGLISTRRHSPALPGRSRAATAPGWNKRGGFLPRPDYLMALGFDALLAASVIWTALDWAAQSALSFRWIVQLLGLAVIHIVFAILHDQPDQSKRF